MVFSFSALIVVTALLLSNTIRNSLICFKANRAILKPSLRSPVSVPGGEGDGGRAKTQHDQEGGFFNAPHAFLIYQGLGSLRTPLQCQTAKKENAAAGFARNSVVYKSVSSVNFV